MPKGIESAILNALSPFLIKYGLNIVMILALPAGNAFNCITDLQIYLSALFYLLLAAEIYLARYRRRRLGLLHAEFHAWDPIIIFNILGSGVPPDICFHGPRVLAKRQLNHTHVESDKIHLFLV